MTSAWEGGGLIPSPCGLQVSLRSLTLHCVCVGMVVIHFISMVSTLQLINYSNIESDINKTNFHQTAVKTHSLVVLQTEEKNPIPLESKQPKTNTRPLQSHKYIKAFVFWMQLQTSPEKIYLPNIRSQCSCATFHTHLLSAVNLLPLAWFPLQITQGAFRDANLKLILNILFHLCSKIFLTLHNYLTVCVIETW